MKLDIITRVMPADHTGNEAAARALAAGGLVAFPTETVYGLGADATNGVAVARLYAAKGRPSFNPLIAHVASLEAARALAQFDHAAARLAASFWPGPLTLVLPKSERCPVSELATAGLDTIAIRIPDHPVAHEILEHLKKPIVAPSANQSGHVSPTTAEHVRADLDGRIDLIIDGGPAQVGVESTIVACFGEPVLLRPGGIARDAIARVLGHDVHDIADAHRPVDDTASRISPGLLASHYAPKARLRLDALAVAPGEALLAFGPARPMGAEHARTSLNLSVTGDPIEAAANLFAHLRALDASGAATIAVMPVPREGLGEAINDRLARAAAPRA